VDDVKNYLEALEKTVESQQKSSKAIKVAKWMKPLLQTLNIAAPIATNLTPLDPKFSSLIPGAISYILTLTSGFLTYQEKLAVMLSAMTEKLTIIIEYHQIHPKDPKVGSALVRLYAIVLQFCVEASRIFVNEKGKKRGGGIKFVKSAWDPFEGKFGQFKEDFDNKLDNFRMASAIRFESDQRAFIARQDSFIKYSYQKDVMRSEESTTEARINELEREHKRVVERSKHSCTYSLYLFLTGNRESKASTS
jgi:hypothetical protein